MIADSIPCPVRTNADAHPDSAAIITAERSWSWAELDGLVAGAAARLNKMTTAGSRVSVQMPTSPEFVVLILSALRTGHVLVPISTRLPEKQIARLRERVSSPHFISNLPFTSHSDVSSELISLGQHATILHTSGSTGEPKAVLHTVGNHFWSAEGLASVLPLNEGDRWMLSLPIYHAGGLAIVYRCALAGAAIVIPERKMNTGEAIEHFNVTHASLVATQLYRLLKEDIGPLRTSKALLLGGGALPRNLLDAARAKGLPIFPSYGLTEMASTVAVASADDSNSSGQIVPYRELTVREGEIHVRGSTRFLGYVEGDVLSQPFDNEGWFATGDLGLLDEGNRLHVTGRKDNRFISGGENIQPEEIEDALLSIEGVTNAIVVSVSDDEFGHRPVAFLGTEGMLDNRAVLASLEDSLPRYKLPVAVYQLPKNEGRAWSRAALAIEAHRLSGK